LKSADNIKDRGIKQATISSYDDYAGFGSGTENRLKNLLELSDADWDDEEEEE
jgi:hypothetical protein